MQYPPVNMESAGSEAGIFVLIPVQRERFAPGRGRPGGVASAAGAGSDGVADAVQHLLHLLQS
jgi:hypothetical protein